MIVYQTTRLHVRVYYRAAHKLKPTLDQVFAQGIGFFCGRGNLP
jgi:hypothetical protein